MPTYLFRRPDGRQIAHTCAMKDCPGDTLTCEDGAIALRDYQAEHSVQDVNPDYLQWTSRALGVHPDQVPERAAFLQSMGVKNFSFDPNGNFVGHSREARRGAMKACGMVDRASFGGKA